MACSAALRDRRRRGGQQTTNNRDWKYPPHRPDLTSLGRPEAGIRFTAPRLKSTCSTGRADGERVRSAARHRPQSAT
jgi:hypothetical protein